MAVSRWTVLILGYHIWLSQIALNTRFWSFSPFGCQEYTEQPHLWENPQFNEIEDELNPLGGIPAVDRGSWVGSDGDQLLNSSGTDLVNQTAENVDGGSNHPLNNETQEMVFASISGDWQPGDSLLQAVFVISTVMEMVGLLALIRRILHSVRCKTHQLGKHKEMIGNLSLDKDEAVMKISDLKENIKEFEALMKQHERMMYTKEQENLVLKESIKNLKDGHMKLEKEIREKEKMVKSTLQAAKGERLWYNKKLQAEEDRRLDLEEQIKREKKERAAVEKEKFHLEEQITAILQMINTTNKTMVEKEEALCLTLDKQEKIWLEKQSNMKDMVKACALSVQALKREAQAADVSYKTQIKTISMAADKEKDSFNRQLLNEEKQRQDLKERIKVLEEDQAALAKKNGLLKNHLKATQQELLFMKDSNQQKEDALLQKVTQGQNEKQESAHVCKTQEKVDLLLDAAKDQSKELQQLQLRILKTKQKKSKHLLNNLTELHALITEDK